VREKVLAAQRADIRTVILPKENEGDLDDLPKDVRRELRFVPVDSVDEVLRVALPEGDVVEFPSAARG
jgi:ATP-dependent Lon protease